MSVAVVIPAREAAAMLPACLTSLQHQVRQADQLLIVVAPSRDETRETAEQVKGPTGQVLENDAGDRGSALNRALQATHADVIALVDAQARIAPDYLETALASLDRYDADVVGGPMRPEGRTPIGRAMAAALQSPFGIGNSQFHFAGAAREVDSVYLGVYRSGVFRRVGRYNPALLRTEDDDMNARVREAGFRIWLDPDIRSVYQCRETLAAIWRQYHGYGYWKVALATIRPKAIRLRHLGPAAFVITIAIAGLASWVMWWPALPALLFVYLMVALVAALLAPADGLAARVLFPAVTFTMHIAYGTGTLRGLIAWPTLRRRVQQGASA